VTTKQKSTKKTVVARQTKKPASVSRARTKTTATTKLRAKVKQTTKKAIVPHKGNGFRPHLIRVQGIVAVLVIAILAQVTYGYFKTGHINVLGRVSDISVSELLNDTNKERQKKGLPQLAPNDQLNQAAFLMAQDMMKNNYWAHVSPTGVQPWKWFADANYNYSYAGENLAKNYASSDATVAAWMGSSTHRENILNRNYADVGFAVVDGTLQGESTTLVVALYGTPVSAAAEAVTQAQSTLGAGVNFASGKVSAEPTGPFAYFGTALLALSPVSIAIIGLFAFVAIVGVVAHHYRKQLPKAWRSSWRMHHGMYTFVGMLVMGVLVIVAPGGGSI